MIEPLTPRDWQDAVNAADHAIQLHAARFYGLVTFLDCWVDINIDRCREMLERGAAQGIVPRPDMLDRFIAEGMKQHSKWPKARQNGR